MPRTFFLLAGEASGDLHAAKLIAVLKALEPDARFTGMGGLAMRAAGLEAVKDLEGMQVVGFWEVAKKYGFFRRVFFQLLDRVRQERPDALICVDYPGFNLRFAREVKKLGIPVLYYIVPQVWAWKPRRAKSMARCVDRAFCVFNFEPPFFEKFGLKTEFVGHPLLDDPPPALDRVRVRRLLLPEADPIRARRFSEARAEPNLIGLFPGSRENEIRHHLRPMAEAVLDEQFGGSTLGWINFPAGAPRDQWLEGTVRRTGGNIIPADSEKGFHRDLAAVGLSREHFIKLDALGIDKAPCRLPDLAAAADFNVVKSGTSTLEAGLSGTPMCVLYKSSAINYAIARLVVNIPVFSLVNIVLGRYAVPELLQDDVNAAEIAGQIQRGLFDEKFCQQQRAVLAELPRKLGGPGASARAAKGMLDYLKGK